MKKFKFPALLVALFGISVAVTGCGGSDEEAGRPGGPGAPGFSGGLVPGGQTPTADGGMAVSFIGNNVYNMNGFLTGGPASYSTYSDYFTAAPYQLVSWGFSQAMNTRYYELNDNCNMPNTGYAQPIQMTMLSPSGVMALPPATNYTSTSSREIGAVLSIGVSARTCGVSSVQGTLTLPAAFLQRNQAEFPQGAGTPISGVAIDLKKSNTGQIYGGILIYTQASGQNPAFLAM